MQIPTTSFAERGETRSIRSSAPAAAHDLSAAETENLVLNLEASLRVYQRAHFFSWTQGLLQGLLPHDVLVCASRGGEPQALRADSFSMIAPNEAIFAELFQRDASFAGALCRAWEDGGFRPLMRDARDGPFAAELARIGSTQILAHGVHDAQGRATHLFAFLSAPGTLDARHLHLARLLTPFLHAAWLRAQVEGRAKGDDGACVRDPMRITVREQEILRWVSRGKSNYEIGAILERSPLTVKNHVQKILRKLDVVNRAQAVGKALQLRILQP